MNNDHIFWVFSAAAQSIAAFVAFLLTGYALVHSLMDAAREKDDTLEEIHGTLRRKYHSRLKLLSWTTGLAIVLSLVVVFANRWEFPLKTWMLGVSAIIDLAAIVGGLAFVVSIVNPREVERTATKSWRRRDRTGAQWELTSAARFFEEFRHLERMLRDYLLEQEVAVARDAPRMPFSFRQMVEALLRNERLDSTLFEELVGSSTGTAISSSTDTSRKPMRPWSNVCTRQPPGSAT